MNIDTILSPALLSIFAKAGVLLLLALYGIFCLIVLIQVRGLTKLVSFTQTPLSGTIVTAFLLHLVLVISLFFLALAIL